MTYPSWTKDIFRNEQRSLSDNFTRKFRRIKLKRWKWVQVQRKMKLRQTCHPKAKQNPSSLPNGFGKFSCENNCEIVEKKVMVQWSQRKRGSLLLIGVLKAVAAPHRIKRVQMNPLAWRRKTFIQHFKNFLLSLLTTLK